jgi:GT2 family glycosyltransferase
MPRPLVSVIILNYNGKKFLKNCIFSTLNTDYPNFEVILVDNASTDESIEIAQYFVKHSNFKIISLEKNMGFSKGNNIGASHASGKYLVFLNNDTVVDKNWLNELLTVIDQDPSIGAVQPKLLFLQNPSAIQSAGNFINSFGFTIPRLRLAEERTKLNCQSEIAATGAALMIRRDLFNHIGRFEPNFFVYYEDSDLSWRIHMAGKSILLVPSSIVYHAEGAGLGSTKLAFRINLYVRNQLFTVFKNYSLRNGLPRVLLLCFLFFGGAIWLMIRKISDIPIAIVKALFQFLKEFPKCWRSHLTAQLIREVDDKELRCFLKPFDFKSLLTFYSSGMGYTSTDY